MTFRLSTGSPGDDSNMPPRGADVCRPIRPHAGGERCPPIGGRLPLVGNGRGERLVGVDDPGDDGPRLDVAGIQRDMRMISRRHEGLTRVEHPSRLTIDGDLHAATEDVTTLDAVMQVMARGGNVTTPVTAF